MTNTSIGAHALSRAVNRLSASRLACSPQRVCTRPHSFTITGITCSRANPRWLLARPVASVWESRPRLPREPRMSRLMASEMAPKSRIFAPSSPPITAWRCITTAPTCRNRTTIIPIDGGWTVQRAQDKWQSHEKGNRHGNDDGKDDRPPPRQIGSICSGGGPLARRNPVRIAALLLPQKPAEIWWERRAGVQSLDHAHGPKDTRGSGLSGATLRRFGLAAERRQRWPRSLGNRTGALIATALPLPQLTFSSPVAR